MQAHVQERIPASKNLQLRPIMINAAKKKSDAKWTSLHRREWEPQTSIQWEQCQMPAKLKDKHLQDKMPSISPLCKGSPGHSYILISVIMMI